MTKNKITFWPTKKLGDPAIAIIIMGQSPPGSTYNTFGNGLPFYQGKKDFGPIYPTPTVWCSAPSKIAEINDILISVRAPVGPVNLCREKSAIGRGLAILRPNKENLNHRFLFLYLKSHESNWKIPGGAVFGAITKKDLENLQIPLPPLSEQKMIVEKIEKIFAKIEEAERLRAESSAASAALFPSALHQVFSRAKKEGWKMVDFQESILKPKRKLKGIPKKKYQLKGRFPIVDQGQNLVAGYTDDKSRIYSENLPVVVFGDHTRIFKYIDFRFAIGADGTRVLIPKNNFDPKYFYYAVSVLNIESLGYSRHFKILKTKKIPLPPIAEQKKIVAYLDALSQKTRALQDLQKQTAADFDALRQSILAKAFSGNI